MKRRFLAIFLTLGIAAQFAVPAWMLLAREYTLRHGTSVLLRTRPVDPADPFRGRYVALDFQDFNEVLVTGTNDFRRGDAIWLSLVTNAAGVATSDAAGKHPGAGLQLKARVSWVNKQMVPADDPPVTNQYGSVNMKATDKLQVRLMDLPCKRYYLPEKIAPAAEKAYLTAQRNAGSQTHARLRIWRGHAFLEDLLIDGKPIRQVLAERPVP